MLVYQRVPDDLHFSPKIASRPRLRTGSRLCTCCSLERTEPRRGRCLVLKHVFFVWKILVIHWKIMGFIMIQWNFIVIQWDINGDIPSGKLTVGP